MIFYLLKGIFYLVILYFLWLGLMVVVSFFAPTHIKNKKYWGFVFSGVVCAVIGVLAYLNDNYILVLIGVALSYLIRKICGGEPDLDSDKIVAGSSNLNDFVDEGIDLADLGKYEEALKIFNKALEIDSKNLITLYNKGIALFELEKYEEAIEVFDEVLEINPENNDSLYAKESAYELNELKIEETLNNAVNDLATGEIDFNTLQEQIASTHQHYDEFDVFCDEKMQQVFNKFSFNQDELERMIGDVALMSGGGYLIKKLKSDPKIMEYYLKSKESGDSTAESFAKLKMRLGVYKNRGLKNKI